MMRGTFRFIPVLLLGAGLFSGQARADGYAAISFSMLTGNWGTATGAATKAEAQEKANANCGQVDCQFVVLVRHGYAALAIGEGNKFGWSWNSERSEAYQRALSSCQKETRGCVVRVLLNSN